MRLSLLFLALSFSLAASAQHTGYSIKLGPTMAMQQWDGFDRAPLFGYHAALQVESISDDLTLNLYAQAGYHRRGSAIRTRRFVGTNPITMEEQIFRPQRRGFTFDNAVLAVGGKKPYDLKMGYGYLLFGLRGEVNVATNLESFNDQSLNFGYGAAYPFEEAVQRFTAGFDVGAGIDLLFNETLEGFAELRLSPDITPQYRQDPFPYYDYITQTQQTTQQRKITNFTLELSLGMRLVRRAYVD